MLRIARGILDGKLGIVAGARKMWRLAPLLRLDGPDVLIFKGIDSETDHLPLGEVRSRWNKEALKRKDEELHRYETQMRARAFQACENLIRKLEQADYSDKPIPHVVTVGLALAVVDGTLQIVRVLPNSPAAKAGLFIGQIVQKIDGVAVDPNNPETWKGKQRGEPGTNVQIELVDGLQGKPCTVELTRVKILATEMGM